MIQNFNNFTVQTRGFPWRESEGKRREGKKRVRSPGETLCKILKDP